MDLKIAELCESLRQIQSTNQDVLHRLNRMSDDTSMVSNTCQCCDTVQELLTEMKDLKSRIERLEQLGLDREILRKSTAEQVQHLQGRLDNIALTIQTDDSKLKRSELTTGELTSDEEQTPQNLRHQHLSDRFTSSRETDISESNLIKTRAENTDELTNSTNRTNETELKFHREESDLNKGNARSVGSSEEKPTQRKKHVSFSESSEILATNSPSQTRTSGSQNSTGPKPRNVANIAPRKSTHDSEVELVLQKEKKTYFGMTEWEYQAHVEHSAAKETELRHLGGFHDVIVLDVSASMAGAWSQVRTFIYDFLKGLEDMARQYYHKEEHVALVTFGYETKVQQRFTNKFSEVRQAFERLKVGGPSPFSAGMLFAFAAAGSTDRIGCNINNSIHQGTRFILITDGEITEPMTYEGPDVMDPFAKDVSIGRALADIEEINRIEGELVCVPVGKSNTEFLELLTSVMEGKIVDYKSGRQLSRKLHLMLQTDTLGLIAGFSVPQFSFGDPLSEDDRRDMEEIAQKERKRLHLGLAGVRGKQPSYRETNTKLPRLGSRVRRGPDWEYSNQDSEGPGTIVGHVDIAPKVWVNWDVNGYIDVYRYGEFGMYDVLLVDEPRFPKPGETIAVGCVIQPGPFWKPVDGMTTNDTGVVIKLEIGRANKPLAKVRWSNGKIMDHAYDVNDQPEIQVCANSLTQEAPVLHSSLPSPKKSKDKNKNKNAT